MFNLSPRLSKLAFQYGVRMHYGNFRTSMIATLFRSIEQESLRAFYFWKSRWKVQQSTSDLTMKWKLWSKMQVNDNQTVSLSEVPIKKMRRPACFVPPRTKPRYITAVRQKLATRERVQKRKRSWTKGAPERQIYSPREELLILVLENEYNYLNSRMSKAKARWRLAFFETSGSLFSN